ncbi:MAG: formate dehydrogenase accessory sulfurtransferase FdhD [Desulfatirhabdiaceae bacterium]
MKRSQPVIHWNGNVSTPDHRDMIMEEPLSIRIDGKPYIVVMRTPGDELSHVAGFCLTEGLVDNRDDIESIARCDGENSHVVTVTIKPERRQKIGDFMDRRGFVSQTSCGICGKELLEELETRVDPIQDSTGFEAGAIMRCMEEISEHQPLRKTTRSSHASLIYDAGCRLMAVAEDVGRHNALDKAIGKLFLSHSLKGARLLILSSRISFDLVQKAARARIPVIVSVSRPTTLAVDLAVRLNMTLACLSPGDGLFIFCGAERLKRDGVSA